MNATALVFQNTTFDIVDRNDDAWLRGPQIGDALGYEKGRISIHNLYETHKDEFTDDMTALVKLPTEGGEQEVRIFSPRGCYALAMFSRTKVAKAFRRWVLDVLESIRKTGKYEAAPYAVNPGDTLTKDEADHLRLIITGHAETLPRKQRTAFVIKAWFKLKAHFKTGYRQIPQAEFSDAVCLIGRHIAEGEYLPRERALPAPISDAAVLEAARAELARPGLRFLTVFSQHEAGPLPVLMAIPLDARYLTDAEIIRHVAEPGGFPVRLLPNLIHAAAGRMTQIAGS